MKHSDYDLNLPEWGPYGKEFVGLSHIADVSAGDRWDCFVLPGFHRRAVVGPYACRENHWHYWKTAPDLRSYTLRYELEWKDQVYVDVTYEGTGQGRFVRVECVNQTKFPQSLDIHLAATISRNPLRPSTVEVPEGGRWIGALEYEGIRFSGQQHRHRQTQDARKPGQWPQSGAVGGECLGAGSFFNHPGDRAEYIDVSEHEIKDAVFLLRYHRWSNEPCRLRLEGFGISRDLELVCDGSPMSQVEIPLGGVGLGETQFSVELIEGCSLLLEGFAILSASKLDEFKVVSSTCDDEPVVEARHNEFLLSYPGCIHTYAIQGPDTLPMRLRRVTGDDLPGIICDQANDCMRDHWRGPGNRESILFSWGPLSLKPSESRSLAFLARLANGQIVEAAPFHGNIDGAKRYAFGMERLAATTLGNVVFPVRHRCGQVRHNTPGRWWDCLYTWDSGMTGLGLAALDLNRAKDCLNQYLLPEDDPYAAFVEHGTPLPTQAELSREIWDQTSDKEWLKSVYPKLANYYKWLAGRSRNSTTDRFKSGLLQTWDYFYNSGGWDDYPPQKALAEEPKRRRLIAPCVTTSFAIRFAGHMNLFAGVLGNPDAQREFKRDMIRWTEALKLSWDADSGYYGYLEHDESGFPVGIYRDKNGDNYNRGLDGISPLLTSTLSKEQRDALLGKVFDSQELLTECGVTTVSRKASYFSDGGYWNGAVWIPYNYMIWKALREQGLMDLSRNLAKCLLNCWEREAEQSYHCFEHFRIDTGRGAGWHQFSGLSSPLLLIYRTEFGD